MPGHVKLGAKGEDPDPEPYLVVSMEAKREDMMKPYDSKKSYWCPDGKGGYAECMVQKLDEKEGEVLMGHIVSLIIDAFDLLTIPEFKNDCHLIILMKTFSNSEKGFQGRRTWTNQSTQVRKMRGYG